MAKENSRLDRTFQQAVQHHQNGQFEKAEVLYEQVLTEDASYTQAYGNLTDVFLKQGKMDLALMRLQSAEKEYPNDPAILTAFCAIFSQTENFNKALDYAKKAVEESPKNVELQLNLASLYNRLQFFEESLKTYQKAIELNPLATEAHYNIGILKYNKGNFAGARNAFRKVINQAPKSFNAYFNMGQIYSDEGVYDKAVKYFQKVLSLNPNQGSAYQRIGMIDHFKGNLESALKNYKTASEKGVTGIEIFTLLGNGNKDIGNTEQAAFYYRKVLELDPNNEAVKTNLSQLSGSKISAWHLEMLADAARNEAYYKAIKKRVPKDSTVLDIGTGSGLLSMMAVRAGAKNVYACEMVPLLADTALKVISNNDFGNQINIFNKKSTALEIGKELPQKVDVVISEILDVGLLGEGVFPSLRDALINLVKPNPIIIPKSADVFGVLIESDYFKKVNPVGDICGFDLSAFDDLRETIPYQRVILNQISHRKISAVFPIHAFDFYNIPPFYSEQEPFKKSLTITATEDGDVHAVAFWFTLHLDGETNLSTGPDGEMIHWGQALCFFETELKVKKGAEINLTMNQSDMAIWFSV